MNAIFPLSPETLHRGAKLFMDRGDARSYGDAMRILEGLRLDIAPGRDAMSTAAGQAALLTAVNLARRTMLGGVRVVACPDAPCVTPLAEARSLRDEVIRLGGILSDVPDPAARCLVIGDPSTGIVGRGALRATWQDWSGGVAPVMSGTRLGEYGGDALSPVLAAALAVSEAFQGAVAETPAAGRRAVGISLWRPDVAWTDPAALGPRLAWLPSSLWLIGLGNLGQAFTWCLGALPFAKPGDLRLTLQDDDIVQPSNESTSVLTSGASFGLTKGRMVAAWAERRGFVARIEERRFGPWTRRADEADDPAVALCGVDNAVARMALEEVGFSAVFEAGLGAGPGGYLNLATHAFPAASRARDIWGRVKDLAAAEPPMAQPAYVAELERLGECGTVTLASRTIGAPFVGMVAACLVLSDPLRRLHGGRGLDACSLSLACPEEVEVALSTKLGPYVGGVAQAA